MFHSNQVNQKVLRKWFIAVGIIVILLGANGLYNQVYGEEGKKDGINNSNSKTRGYVCNGGAVVCGLLVTFLSRKICR